jgi:aromatic ring-cleaving dioxygenase
MPVPTVKRVSFGVDSVRSHDRRGRPHDAAGVTTASWLDRPGGPCRGRSFQVEVTIQLSAVTEWLTLHRERLSVL